VRPIKDASSWTEHFLYKMGPLVRGIYEKEPPEAVTWEGWSRPQPEMTQGVRRQSGSGEIFFVYSYSHSTYVDHGGVHYARLPCPHSAWWRVVATSPLPSAQACPKKE